MTAPQFICDQSNRDQWLTERMTGIGSSDAPAILGLEKAFGNPFKISCLKRGMRIDEEDSESELLKWGHYVEAPMIAAFSDETGHHGQLSGAMWRRTDKGREFMMATLDGPRMESGIRHRRLEAHDPPPHHKPHPLHLSQADLTRRQPMVFALTLPSPPGPTRGFRGRLAIRVKPGQDNLSCRRPPSPHSTDPPRPDSPARAWAMGININILAW